MLKVKVGRILHSCLTHQDINGQERWSVKRKYIERADTRYKKQKQKEQRSHNYAVMIVMKASKTSKWCKRSNILGHLSHTGFIAQCLIGEGNEMKRNVG